MPCGVTSSGACGVAETLADTGPPLHLKEIGRLTVLTAVAPMVFPELVWEELRNRGVLESDLTEAGIGIDIRAVDEDSWKAALAAAHPFRIQPADAQVFTLASATDFRSLVLTDDLALRRALEARGATVAGSVGLLIRGYSSKHLDRTELEMTIDSLIETSTLHLSPAFRVYLRKLIADLP